MVNVKILFLLLTERMIVVRMLLEYFG